MSQSFASLVASTVILTAACDGATGPGADAIATASSAAASATRPASGDCATTFAPSDFTFPLLTIQIEGACNLLHAGRASLHATQVIDVTDGSFTNVSTYVAANGDEIHTSFAGTPTSPPGSSDVTFVGQETYLGGTGRFLGVSGQAAATGRATIAPDQSGVGAYRIDGWITY